MAPTLDFVSLVASDLKRTEAFYRDGLGIAPENISAEDGHLKLAFENDLTLVFYAHAEFEKEFGDIAGAGPASGLILTQSVERKEDVTVLIARAIAAGGSGAGPAVEQEWGGYAGYVKDPDGHLWEIVWEA